MYWLIVLILVVVGYTALKVFGLSKGQLILPTFLEEQFKKIGEPPKPVEPRLAYGWFDDGWPVAKSDEEERGALENPELRAMADEYGIAVWTAEYRSLTTAGERKRLLRQLQTAGVYLSADLLDTVYADESVSVRAWAAAHLPTEHTDYTDLDHPVKTRDYEPAILADPEPVVRAALWSNPKCQRLPFSSFDIAAPKNWEDPFRQMSRMERLALMRNPHLSKHYVLALLDTSTERLGISRQEHAAIVCAGALNPDIIGESRFHGRDFWVVEGDPNPPFKEYGMMWDLCVDKWMQDRAVAYTFLTYIQTTPQKKLEVYKRLQGEGDTRKKLLREAIIHSCDPIKDRDVLKTGWEDSDEECRKAAKERVGPYTKFVAVNR
jgi:hypothetical protein